MLLTLPVGKFQWIVWIFLNWYIFDLAIFGMGMLGCAMLGCAKFQNQLVSWSLTG